MSARVAVLSGGAGGIATACAQRLLADGARVALIDRDGAALDEAAARLRDVGRVVTLTADVADADALADAFARVRADLGSAGVAVSAVAHEDHRGWAELDASALDHSLRVTVGGAFSFCRLAAGQMIESHARGRIVIVSSLHAVLPFAGAVAYNAAQAGLRQLGLTLARELLEYRIAVNLVEPGWIDTPGERRWYTEEQLAAAGARLPWGRLGAPDDVAAAVAFLSSEQADYVTGAVVRVDGGMSLDMARLPGGDA